MSQIWDIVWPRLCPAGMWSIPMDSWNSGASRSELAGLLRRPRSSGAAWRAGHVIADDAWAEVRKSWRSSKPWRMIRSRITGYPPASAPSQPVTSRSSCGPSCSAAWSAHMLPDRDLRSMRWCGPSCCCELRPLPPADRDSRRDPAQLRRHAQRRLTPVVYEYGKPRLLRRPGSACSLRAGADG